MRLALAWLSPASLAGRTLLTLLAGLLFFHLGSLWLLDRDVHSALEQGRDFQAAKHLSAAVRVLGAIPEELRETGARAFSYDDFQVIWLRVAATEMPDDAALTGLRARLQQRAPELDGLQLWYGSPSPGARRVIQGRARLSDGSWIGFAISGLEMEAASTHASLSSLIAMAMGIVLASLLVVRWITSPLRRFTKAAEDFGKDGAPAPLLEEGPREVREAARTFNAMQARIHQLVEDRTQALAAVSHDLRTPIQRLRLRAGFLADPEAQGLIEADLEEMEEMIDSTLAYLRGDSDGEIATQADLAAIIRTLCDDAMDRGLAVTYAGPDRAPFCLRRLAMKRAIANLIDNAVKYGGNVLVTLLVAPDSAIIRVEDDGPGIPEQHLEAVFEPFQRLEESRNRNTGGTGLGLTIARRIVQAHGGTLKLANKQNAGLVATVRLLREPTGAPERE